jgi:hypothetical protein
MPNVNSAAVSSGKPSICDPFRDANSSRARQGEMQNLRASSLELDGDHLAVGGIRTRSQ